MPPIPECKGHRVRIAFDPDLNRFVVRPAADTATRAASDSGQADAPLTDAGPGASPQPPGA